MNSDRSAGKYPQPQQENNHASLVVLYKVEDDGTVQMVTFTSRQLDEANDYPKWVFPTETAETTDFTPQQTAHAGIQTEVAKVEKSLSVMLDNNEQPIHTKPVRGDRGGTHTKFVFLGQILGGQMRTLEKPDENKKTGRKELLAPPEFKEAEELLDLMNQRGKPFHRVALVKVLSFLAKDPRIMKKYWKLLENAQSE